MSDNAAQENKPEHDEIIPEKNQPDTDADLAREAKEFADQISEEMKNEETGNHPEVEKLKKEIEEHNEKYLRLFAEFDNYRRRTQKEKLELSKTAGEEIFKVILPVLDNFERGLKAMETAADVTALKEGVLLIYNQLKSNLVQKGLEPMESVGTVFDAEIHEAITNIPAPSDEMKGKVVDEVEKGYSLNGKVIRFAKVVVGN